MTFPRRATLRDLLTQQLDRPYQRLITPTVQAAQRMARPGTRLYTALQDLEAAAREAQKAGTRLNAASPAVRAFVAEAETALKRHRIQLDAVADQMVDSGARAGQTIARYMAFPGVSNQQLAGIGIGWDTPNLDATLQVLDWTRQPAWDALLGGLESDVLTSVNKLVVSNILHGRNPVAGARAMRTVLPEMTRSRSEAIARTLQMQAYRRSTAINYTANSNILEDYGIRYASLDANVCLGCAALHGTRVPIDEPIDEHYNGRCIVVPVVRGSTRDVQTGEAWFAAQDAATQERIMGGARYRAWQDGKVQLKEFAGTTKDALFGDMLQTLSLRGVLGDEAKNYYVRGG